MMKLDALGVPRFSQLDLVNLIYEGKGAKLSTLLVEKTRDTDLYNEYLKKLGIDLLPLKEYQPLPYDQEQFDKALQSEWFMPDKYKNLDIYDDINFDIILLDFLTFVNDLLNFIIFI